MEIRNFFSIILTFYEGREEQLLRFFWHLWERPNADTVGGTSYRGLPNSCMPGSIICSILTHNRIYLGEIGISVTWYASALKLWGQNWYPITKETAKNIYIPEFPWSTAWNPAWIQRTSIISEWTVELYRKVLSIVLQAKAKGKPPCATLLRTTPRSHILDHSIPTDLSLFWQLEHVTRIRKYNNMTTPLLALPFLSRKTKDARR